jgi:SAM-dependent methyltransferase
MTTSIQKTTFLEGGEADAWFARNRSQLEAPSPLRDAVVHRIAGHLDPERTADVLEIGCGRGNNLLDLARLRPLRAHGIEPSAAAVEQGRGQEGLDLRCGTSDLLPWADTQFDLVWFGFCLYLVDRSLLMRSVAEADRVLRDGGTLAILDFDPDTPCRRQYHHRSGLWSYKMDYARLFLANPAYRMVDRLALSHAGPGWSDDPQERLALSLLRKDTQHAYRTDI